MSLLLLTLRFEDAKLISNTIHYLISFGLPLWFIGYRHNKDPYRITVRLLLAFYAWLFLSWVAGACPLSYLENVIGQYFYGQDFMPISGFTGTDAYALITRPDVFFNLMFLTIIVSIHYLWGLINPFHQKSRQ